MGKIEQEPAFILHSRNYTDSRILIELFTYNFGRVSAVFRPPKKKSLSVKPQCFTPLLVDFYGKSGLKTVGKLEAQGKLILTQGSGLYCGMYLNELIMRLLAVDDPHPRLFEVYAKSIAELSTTETDEEDVVLRGFEMVLLSELGYAIDMQTDIDGRAITPESGLRYEYDAGCGFRLIQTGPEQRPRFSATEICAIRDAKWQETGARRAAKMLSRIALAPLLGERPLLSRELFK